MKNEVYNLIILDESGSMGCVTRQTIDGCNETINTIKSAQKMYAETQEHFVSIYAFQSSGEVPSRFIVKNVPADAAVHISDKDYQPWGGTPLYDAIGETLADLKAVVKNRESAIGSVTIITDGYENASRHYTRRRVANMISELKELGWNFNFIGANIDVDATADSLNIDNRLAFEQNEAGTQMMFERERRSKMAYMERLHNVNGRASMNQRLEDRLKDLREASANYYDDIDEEEKKKK